MNRKNLRGKTILNDLKKEQNIIIDALSAHYGTRKWSKEVAEFLMPRIAALYGLSDDWYNDTVLKNVPKNIESPIPSNNRIVSYADSIHGPV